MKLQILTNLYPLPWETTRAAFNRQQFLHLSKRFTVSVLVLVPWREIKGRSKLLRPDYGGQPPVEYLKYYYLPGFGRVTYALTLFIALLGWKKVARLRKIDCFFLSWAYPDGVAGVLLAKLLGVPAVIKVHGSDVNMHMDARLRSAQIVWAMRHAKAVISVSSALAERLIEAGVSGSKIHVIYNGIDHSLFRPMDRVEAASSLRLPLQRRRLLYIGNLKEAKGCLDLFEAFVRLADHLADVDLVYIGGGKASEKISRQAVLAGLESRVLLQGVLDHAVLPKWINACSIVVLPSHAEGVPNVLLEAMACGTPVVATKVGGIPEVVGRQAGILVRSRDINALSDALKTALESTWDPEAIAQAAAKFNWQANADRVEELLNSVVEPNSAVVN